MIELNETTVKDFIKEGKVIIKGWMDDCSFCDDFAPTFLEAEKLYPDFKFGALNIPKSGASEFRRNYMKSKPGESAGAPAVFVFENGELLRKHHGNMPMELLRKFISGEVMPPSQMELKEKEASNLFRIRGELTYNLEILSKQLVEVDKKLAELFK